MHDFDSKHRQTWLIDALTKNNTAFFPVSAAALRVEPLVGDAGQRQYFRVKAEPEGSWIFACYPPGTAESLLNFVQLAGFFQRYHLHTPNVVAHDEACGYLLLEDFGSEHIFDVVSPENVDGIYAQAMMELLKIQQIPLDDAEASELPLFDQAFLRRELLLFQQWFVESLLNYSMAEAEVSMMLDTFALLEDCALQQPQVVMHRDFHSRNLLLVPGESLGVIDFQDAVQGPLFYDVASLLKDCYIQWPRDDVERWLATYRSLVVNAGVGGAQLCAKPEPQWLLEFDWIGCQRHIKVLGIFARLALRDDKPRYLHDLPRVVGYVREVLGMYSELARFHAWFETALMPLIQKQPWWCEGQVA